MGEESRLGYRIGASARTQSPMHLSMDRFAVFVDQLIVGTDRRMGESVSPSVNALFAGDIHRTIAEGGALTRT